MFGKRDNEGGLQARIHALNAKRGDRPALQPVPAAAKPAHDRIYDPFPTGPDGFAYH